MTVDMVFAISHSRIMRERMRNRLEYLKKCKRNECMVDSVVDSIVYSPLYNKHISTDLNVEKVKQQSCLEMFKIW